MRARYVSLEEKKKSGVKRQNEVMIHRKRKNPTHSDQTLSIPYRVTDNPLRLGSGEWCVSIYSTGLHEGEGEGEVGWGGG